MNLTIALKILNNVLEAWNLHESNKYVDEMLEIKKELFEEKRKPSYEFKAQYPNHKAKDFRNTARIDELISRMLDISEIALQAASNRE